MSMQQTYRLDNGAIIHERTAWLLLFPPTLLLCILFLSYVNISELIKEISQ